MTEPTTQEVPLPWYTKTWNTLKTSHPAWLIVIWLIILQWFTIYYYESQYIERWFPWENNRQFSPEERYERGEKNRMNRSHFQDMESREDRRMNMEMPRMNNVPSMQQNTPQMNRSEMKDAGEAIIEKNIPSTSGTGKNIPPQPMPTQTKSGVIAPSANK